MGLNLAKPIDSPKAKRWQRANLMGWHLDWLTAKLILTLTGSQKPMDCCLYLPTAIHWGLPRLMLTGLLQRTNWLKDCYWGLHSGWPTGFRTG